MKCNIDQKGRAVRVILGGVIEGAGLLLLVLAAVGQIEGTWPWIVGISAAIGGGIMVVEGAVGWCFVRAMGIRTPL